MSEPAATSTARGCPPEAVEAAHRQVAEVERRGTVAAHTLRADEEVLEERQVPLRELAHVVTESR